MAWKLCVEISEKSLHHGKIIWLPESQQHLKDIMRIGSQEEKKNAKIPYNRSVDVFFYLAIKEQRETTFEVRRRLNDDFSDFFNY